MSNNLYNGLLAVLAGVCSVSYIFSGLYIFSPAVNDRRIRPLLYSCFFSSVWCCCYMMYYLSTGADMKDFWLRFMFAGMVAFVFPLWFFIKYIDFTANKKTIRFFRDLIVFFAYLWVTGGIDGGNISRTARGPVGRAPFTNLRCHRLGASSGFLVVAYPPTGYRRGRGD